MNTKRIGKKRTKIAPVVPLKQLTEEDDEIEEPIDEIEEPIDEVEEVRYGIKRLQLSSSDSSESSDESDDTDSDSTESEETSSDTSSSEEITAIQEKNSCVTKEKEDEEEWPVASLENPLGRYRLIPTAKLETKYCVIIPIYIASEPLHCKLWNTQFRSNNYNTNSEIKVGEKRKRNVWEGNEKMYQHWDIFLTLISFERRQLNKGKLWARVYESIDESKKDSRISYDNYVDHFVKISKDITMILRVVPLDDIRYRYRYNWRTEEILLRLSTATHNEKQKNIYLDKHVLSSDMAWILHSIINERKMGLCNPLNEDYLVNFKRGKKTIYTDSIRLVYQAMFAIYSQNIS